MLQDKSPELSESWIFLRKRIEDLRSMKQMNVSCISFFFFSFESFHVIVELNL